MDMKHLQELLSVGSIALIYLIGIYVINPAGLTKFITKLMKILSKKCLRLERKLDGEKEK